VSAGVDTSTSPLIRIGELSRRTGVSIDRLRSWERRYGLLHPARSPGGFRLYSAADERRVRALQDQLAAGVSAAEAARAILAADPTPRRPFHVRRDELVAALTGFDAARAGLMLDDVFAALGVEAALATTVFPALREIGDGWADARLLIGQEHFASNLLEGRLLSLLNHRPVSHGPLALLACASGEAHTLGLIALGIALRNRGWRIAYLGADTPVADVQEAAARIDPAITVISATMGDRLAGTLDGVRELARNANLALAGPGAGRVLADRVGARLLEGDPFAAAAAVARPADEIAARLPDTPA
jgi:MerR family transcriptional regulator, light-induced transcriptional regulator